MDDEQRTSSIDTTSGSGGSTSRPLPRWKPMHLEAELPDGSDTWVPALQEAPAPATKLRPVRVLTPQLSDVDVEWLQFMGRARVVTPGQLSHRYGVADRTVRERLARLEAMGLALRQPHGPGSTPLVTPTPHGLKIAGCDVPVLRLAGHVRLEHELLAASVLTQYEVEGELVVTAVEIEAALDGKPLTQNMQGARDLAGLTDRDDLYFAAPHPVGHSPVTQGVKRSEWHVPDLVVVRRKSVNEKAPGHIAVEVERSRKEAPKLRRILDAYNCAPPTWYDGAASTGFGELRYVCRTRAGANLVQARTASYDKLKPDPVVLDVSHYPGLPSWVR